MSSIDRAIVIGASIAGLMAARALSDLVDEVLVIERDELPTGPEHRKGVGQAKQIHILLPAGLEIVEEMLPGFTDTMVADGAVLGDCGRDIAYITPQGWQARASADLPFLGLTRPKLEWRIRERVLALPNVTVRRGVVTGLAGTEDGSAVAGVILRNQPEIETADLVVDASGRGSKSPQWMEELGYDAPEEIHVNPWIGYASQLIRIPPGTLPEGVLGIEAIGPMVKRGGLIWPAGNGLHWLAANGQMRDYPPRERDDLLAWLADGLTPLLAEIAAAAEPVGEIATYKKPGNQRRLWERMTRRPAGFVAVGDSVASLNPIYAQGMTLSAYGALKLGETVRTHGADMSAISHHFPAALSPKIDTAFALSAAGDAMIDGVELTNFDRPEPEASLRDDALAALTTEDPEVAVALLQAVANIDLAPLETQEIQSRIDERIASGATPAPVDPRRVPALSTVAEKVIA